VQISAGERRSVLDVDGIFFLMRGEGNDFGHLAHIVESAHGSRQRRLSGWCGHDLPRPRRYVPIGEWPVPIEFVSHTGARIIVGDRTFINYGSSISAHELVTIGRHCLLGHYTFIPVAAGTLACSIDSQMAATTSKRRRNASSNAVSRLSKSAFAAHSRPACNWRLPCLSGAHLA
jgi:acetyltransferase-like isoleucine patch superfamily enzyme